jgi:site-specific DNA-methyltransferase (adenine-specific)
MSTAALEHADAGRLYAKWPAPTAIIVDGPYGVAGFPGDPPTPHELHRWYLPHAVAWAEHSTPQTTLWFWGTELSWATVHPVLEMAGWEYRTTHIWNKGIAHIAGNVNGLTIRRFPIASEVCVQYVRRVELTTESGELLHIKEWLRAEWLRTGLPLSRTNEAAGVKNAATRKYFTQCHLWYFPPPKVMERVAKYANRYGKRGGRPYFSLNGKRPLSAAQWSRLRSKWNHQHGITNVWDAPPVHGQERVKDLNGRYLHTNQKPLSLIERIIEASTDRHDVVWDPFAGLATVGVAAAKLGRKYFGAEIDERVYEAAVDRLLREKVNVETSEERSDHRRQRSAQGRQRRTSSADCSEALVGPAARAI